MSIGSLLTRLGPRRWLSLASRIRGDAEFLVAGERRLTRRQVFARVETLAAGLQALGLRPGDRVATLLPASAEAVYALFLPWALGNWEVPLNPLLREHELRHILADSGAKAILTTQRWYGHDYPALLARLLPDLPNLRAVVVQGAGGGDGRVFFPLEQVMRSGRPLHRDDIRADKIGRIAYTSGTTGLPKGVVRSWTRYWGLLRPSALPHLDPRLFRSVLSLFPLCYYHGVLVTAATLLTGGRLVLLDRFHPRQALETIEKERVTLLGAAPTMYRLLLRTPEQEKYDLSSVRRVFFGTEVCPPDLAQVLHQRFRCPLENMYATNETGNITWMPPRAPWQRAAATVGKPAAGVRLRIVDDERRPLPRGQVGEIAVQTTQMMLGYYNAPALTTRFLDEEGWFYTGDLGYLGDDGYLRLTGRKKDVIIRGGQKIYPEEVEHYLEQHPAIRRAGVVGRRSDLGGEAVCAFLELNPGATLTEREVLDFCRGRIAPFKIPDQVQFVERLPTTVTGKVQRFRLREMVST